jgi:segregation and condensation protein A
VADVHEVKTEVFEGPIDLLLHLITRQRVDIYEISLATITEEYLRAVSAMDEVDLEKATGFLVVAATLLELKSSRLLPGRSADDLDPDLLEERDLLLAKLVETATFKEAGGWLWAGLEEGAGFHPRTAGPEPELVSSAPDLLRGLKPQDLARAAATALNKPPPLVLDTSHLAPIRASVHDAIVELSGRLSRQGSATFEALCTDAGERIEVVVRFLAVLELFKAGAVDMGQADRFGSIRVAWTGETTVASVLEEAEEYTIDQGGRK